MVVLDNAHMMDPASWDLYEAIRDGCYRIVVILLLQTDYNDGVKIHSSCRDTFERVWQSSNMDENRVIELPNLNTKSLEEMLINNAKQYQNSYMNEVRKMTEIINPSNTIKNPEESKMWRQKLIN